MILCVSLNPSIDRTLRLQRLERGGLNRILSQTDVAAGKGVNVALAAAALGEPATCVGLMYADGAGQFAQRLERAGVESEFVSCPGSVRVNTKLFDRERGEITELNAGGVPVEEAQLRAVEELVRRRARGASCIVLTGSLPPLCPPDFYATLARISDGEGCRVLLDADGERLRLGIAAHPRLIKPNRSELQQLAGRKLGSLEEILQAALSCVREGVGVVAVSLGSEGALITDGQHALHTPGLRVEVRSTVAAGDSMLAGLAVGMLQGASLEDAFRLGVGAATARCATPPEEALPAALARRYAGELTVEQLG